MTYPSAPVDHGTASLLDLLAQDQDYTRFLRVCEAVSDLDAGFVKVNEVRAFVAAHGIDINPRRYSAFWRKAELDGHLARTGDWDICRGSGSGNDGRPQPRRRWVG